MEWKYLIGDVREVLKTLPEKSIQTCVTSPPYWGLRDYGTGNKQLGLEPTSEEYVKNMVEVFQEVKRVLRDDGTLWLNLGDSYAGGCASSGGKQRLGPDHNLDNQRNDVKVIKSGNGLKQKDLVGIPWRVAFALQSDGWYLRSDIIWSKPNPMPESVTDRPTKAHEYIFLLSKSKKYYYDNDAIKEPVTESSMERLSQNIKDQQGYSRVPFKTNGNMKAVISKQDGVGKRTYNGFNKRYDPVLKRNKRTVWEITTKPFKEAHFAVFPPEIPTICIKAGSKEGDTVLDPFAGSGTSLMVARELGRSAIGIDINEDYKKMAEKRAKLNIKDIFEFKGD